jgi:hypothetical protein
MHFEMDVSRTQQSYKSVRRDTEESPPNIYSFVMLSNPDQ